MKRIKQQRLQQINFGFNLNNANTKVIKETDKYVLQSYNLDKSNGGYMEVSGFFNKNMIFLMRMAVQSINESVSISMKFFVYVGTFVSLIGIIVAFVISGEFTRPILHLADISKEMSNLNFNVKYDNKDLLKNAYIVGAIINILLIIVILLFSDLKRFDVFPIDVWVRRVMNELYIHNEDENKVDKKLVLSLANDKFADLQGIAQQYLFFWKRGI